MLPTAQSLTLPIDQNGSILTDTPCLQCGYNLRGLNHLGNCPECNAPASLALQGDMLRFADPRWLDTLAKGCSFYLWGLLVAICAGMVVGFVTGLLGAPKIGQVAGFLGSLVSLYGIWLITHPDPSGITEERNGKARKWVRAAVLYGLAHGILTILLMGFSLPPTAAFAFVPLGIAAMAFQTIGEVCKYFYLRGLAERIPNPEYANRAKQIAWVYVITMPIIAIGAIALMISMFTNLIPGGGPAAFGLTGLPFLPKGLLPPMASAPAVTTAPPTGPTGAALVTMLTSTCVIAPAGLILAVFQILGLILIYKLGQAFREQSHYARAIMDLHKNPTNPIEARPITGADVS